MKGYFAVTILTKPYIKKYLNFFYGDPVLFTTTNYFGMSVAPHFEKPIRLKHNYKVLKFRVEKYTAEMTIVVPQSYLRKRHHGYYITDRATISLNKLFEARFDEDLWRFVKNKGEGLIKDAIEQFAKEYSLVIDEDITYESLKKKEYRFGERIKNLEINSKISVPQLSPENSRYFQQKMF